VACAFLFLILQAEQRRWVNGDEDPQSVRHIEDRVAIGLNWDRSARKTLRSRRSKGDDKPWTDRLDFVKKPTWALS
jgi:hypothetical protein